MTGVLICTRKASPVHSDMRGEWGFLLQGEVPLHKHSRICSNRRRSEEQLPTEAEQEFFRYHHRFGHVSFAKASSPTPEKCQIPEFNICSEKQQDDNGETNIRKDWKNQSEPRQPGETVTADQLVSPISRHRREN
jgi:hypothetical protein